MSTPVDQTVTNPSTVSSSSELENKNVQTYVLKLNKDLVIRKISFNKVPFPGPISIILILFL